MAKIQKVEAREILDSRGIPTIEGLLTLDDNATFYAQASSGESVGKYEGMELRDNNELKYNGLGVMKAVYYINELIGKKLINIDISRHIEIDKWLCTIDKSKNTSTIGVNTIMTMSQLLLKAAANNQSMSIYQYVNTIYNSLFKKNVKIKKIPTPMFNMLNGGKHGIKNLDFQEYLIVPSSSTKFIDSLEYAVSFYRNLRDIFKNRNMTISVSEEGGYTPSLYSNGEALEVLKQTILQKKLKLGLDIFIGLDCAASFYYKNGKYHLKESSAGIAKNEYIDYLIDLVKTYSILILEDPIDDEDSDSWKTLKEKLEQNSYVVADDFVAGNMDRLKKALSKNACDGVVMKYNQVGTIIQLLELANSISSNNLKIIFSQRLGETTDSIIADISVGIQADYVKFGPPSRGERVVKYNRLLEIESQLNILNHA